MSGDGAVYDLARRHDGRVTCDCPHYTARIEGLSEDLCKHGRALVELKLLPAPRPTLAADRQIKPAPKLEPTPPPEPTPDPGAEIRASLTALDAAAAREHHRRRASEPTATTTTPSGSASAPAPDGAAAAAEVRPEPRPITAADRARRAAFGIQLPEATAEAPGSLQGEPTVVAEETPTDPPPTPPERSQTAEDPAASGDPAADADPDDPADLDDPWGLDDRIGLGPEPLLPRSALADWIDQQAAEYRQRGGSAARWLAQQLDQMASTARVLQAANGAQYDDRLDAMEDARDRRLAEEAVDRFAAAMSLATA
jgi:hypothetical protein